jgi:hypothetical protein
MAIPRQTAEGTKNALGRRDMENRKLPGELLGDVMTLEYSSDLNRSEFEFETMYHIPISSLMWSNGN